MFKELQFLDRSQVEELKQIASRAQFVDGRISNPHSKVKNNLQLHDQQAYQKSAQIVASAMMAHEDFRNYAFPAKIAPPLLTRYAPGMHYGPHTDNASIMLPAGPLRTDLSCTIFLDDPDTYEGGALCVHLGARAIRFRLQPGWGIVYPSDTLHEVEPVSRGERLAAITFIQSSIKSRFERELLYDLNEVAALEGLKMAYENYSRLHLVQQKLLRYWSDKP